VDDEEADGDDTDDEGATALEDSADVAAEAARWD
jgi:hypothetical protein